MLKTLKLLLPALMPSWRFFDVIAPSPRIEFALLENAQEVPQHWQEFRTRPVHLSLGEMLKRLFWNPEWNESLFLVSCAERLMQYPTEHSHQEILKRIVAENARQGEGAAYVQFRLVFLHREGAEVQKDVTYISSVYRRQP